MYTATKMKDYYSILGVSKNATFEEIKRAFREKAKQYHPDKCSLPNAQELFIEIAEAYEVLRDSNSRSNYDQLFEKTTNTSYTNNAYTATEEGKFNEAQQKAHTQAKQYASMSFEDVLGFVFGVALDVGKTILTGEKNKPEITFIDYIKLGFIGIALTICLILLFTGVGTIPAGAVIFLTIKGLLKNDKFIGIGPFLLCTIVADLAVVLLLGTLISSFH